MYLIYVVFIAIGILLGLTGSNTQSIIAMQTASTTVSNAQAMGVLASGAVTYLQMHPGTTGNVPASSMPLPAWFTTPANGGAVYQGGLSYVYLVPETPAAGALLATELANRGFSSGIANNGALFSPGGAAVVAAPTSLPAGAVVLIQ